jgi:hypothetical protein
MNDELSVRVVQGYVELVSGEDNNFKSVCMSSIKTKTDEELNEFVLNAIDEYQGRFFLFNVATQRTFLNNTIIEFNKGKK